MSVPEELYAETLGRRSFNWNQNLDKLPAWKIPGFCLGTKKEFVEHYSEEYTITVKQDSKEKHKDDYYLAGCYDLRMDLIKEDFYVEYRYTGYITRVNPLLMETDSMFQKIKPVEQTVMLVFAKQPLEFNKPHALSEEQRQQLQEMCDFQICGEKGIPALIRRCREVANPIRLSFLVMHFDVKDPHHGYYHFYRDNGNVVDLDRGTSGGELMNLDDEAYFRIDSEGIFLRNSRDFVLNDVERMNTIQVATYHETKVKDPVLKAVSIVDTQIDLLDTSESMEEEMNTQHAVKKEFSKEVIKMEEEEPQEMELLVQQKSHLRRYPKVCVRLYINHVLRLFYEEDLMIGRELVNIKVKTERDRYDWSN